MRAVQREIVYTTVMTAMDALYKKDWLYRYAP